MNGVYMYYHYYLKTCAYEQRLNNQYKIYEVKLVKDKWCLTLF